MLIGTSVVVGEYIATNSASYQGLPFLMNVVDTSEEDKNYVNVVQYFEKEGVTSYVNGIEAKLNIHFNRTVFKFKFDNGKEVIVNLFFDSEFKNLSDKGDIGIIQRNKNNVKVESSELSLINAAFAERQGSSVRAEPLVGTFIRENELYKRYIYVLLGYMDKHATNNKVAVEINESFFFPIKQYGMDVLSARYKSAIEKLSNIDNVNMSKNDVDNMNTMDSEEAASADLSKKHYRRGSKFKKR